jgi:hypothetical protein
MTQFHQITQKELENERLKNKELNERLNAWKIEAMERDAQWKFLKDGNNTYHWDSMCILLYRRL